MNDTDPTPAIRPALPSDVDRVVRFNELLALETEQKELDSSQLRRGVEQALGEQGPCRYFVAEHDGQVIGQAMVTREWSDWRNGYFWWLQSVYVERDYRRRGVLRSLYEHVVALAETTADVCGLRLYVDKQNEEARSAYRQLGMVMTEYLVYEREWPTEG